MLRLQCLPELEFNSAVFDRSIKGKTKCKLRLKPNRIEGIARPYQIVEDAQEIRPDVMWQHEAVMQRRPPAHQIALLRFSPKPGDERAQHQLLREAHPRIWRHFKSPEFDEPEPPRRTIRRIEFVDTNFRAMRIAGHIDKQVAVKAIDMPRRCRFAGAWRAGERDFKFIERVVPCLIDTRRLARRAD